MRLIISNLAREYPGFIKQIYWEILCFAKASLFIESLIARIFELRPVAEEFNLWINKPVKLEA